MCMIYPRNRLVFFYRVQVIHVIYFRAKGLAVAQDSGAIALLQTASVSGAFSEACLSVDGGDYLPDPERRHNAAHTDWTTLNS